jgi:hypothetical protein
MKAMSEASADTTKPVGNRTCAAAGAAFRVGGNLP